jgi:choline-glycine betaine transporter
MPLGAVLGVIAMLLVAIFFVSGADAASIVMGTLSQRGTIHPTRNVVVFWGAVMGAIGAIMLLVGGGKGDALSGIQNITIIMAAPFTVVMVLMCVSLARDLRSDPLVRRGLRSTRAIEQAVEFGQREYGDAFFVPVKPHPIERPLSVDDGTRDGSVAPTTRQEETAVQRAEERTDDRVLPPRARAEEATS